MAVEDEPRLNLFEADRVAQDKVKMSGEVAHLVPAFGELALERDAFLARELTVVARPGGVHGSAAAESVGELCDGERIDVMTLKFSVTRNPGPVAPLGKNRMASPAAGNGRPSARLSPSFAQSAKFARLLR